MAAVIVPLVIVSMIVIVLMRRVVTDRLVHRFALIESAP